MPERRTPFYEFHRRAARNLVKRAGTSCSPPPTPLFGGAPERAQERGMQDSIDDGGGGHQGAWPSGWQERLLVNEVQDRSPGSWYSTMCNEGAAS